MHYHDYPKQLEQCYIKRLRRVYAKRAKLLKTMRSEAHAEQYRERVRKTIVASFGRLPERSPLNVRVWKTNQYGDHSIRHLTYESRPGFIVSANLYLPLSAPGPLPGVLFPCGHSGNGKAYPLYVEACIRLAREGYAVLIYDPVNQGERDLYSALETGGRVTRENPCSGHNIIGRQLHASGDWLGAWMVWDGLRGADLLAQHPEVDGARLAVAGQSGGGTLSAYLWAMDPRFRAVASSCWCTSYLNDLENGMPADDEQYPPGFLAAGLDKIDMFMARAGEPTLLLGQELDFFDDRGLRAGYAELLRLHRLLGGRDEDCRLELDKGTHAFSQANQRAMLSFFNRVFGKAPPAPDRPVEPHSESDLQVTPDCHVDAAGSRPMRELVAERARAITARRPAALGRLPAIVRQTLGIAASRAVPHYRRLLHTASVRPGTGQHVYRFAVETEVDLCCVLRRVCRHGTPCRLSPGTAAVIYLPDMDSQKELEDPDTMSGVEDFWVFDARGLGEGLAGIDDPWNLYGHEYMAAGHALLFGETLLGDRVGDVLAAVRLLRLEGAAEIRLVGRRQGGIIALLAGLLDRRIAGVDCLKTPESFLELASAPYTYWPAVNFPHGVLARFDLPEVRATLRERLGRDTRADPIAF